MVNTKEKEQIMKTEPEMETGKKGNRKRIIMRISRLFKCLINLLKIKINKEGK